MPIFSCRYFQLQSSFAKPRMLYPPSYPSPIPIPSLHAFSLSLSLSSVFLFLTLLLSILQPTSFFNIYSITSSTSHQLYPIFYFITSITSKHQTPFLLHHVPLGSLTTTKLQLLSNGFLITSSFLLVLSSFLLLFLSNVFRRNFSLGFSHGVSFYFLFFTHLPLFPHTLS